MPNTCIKPSATSPDFRYIRKRDGTIVDFDPNKIASAIRRAGVASGEFNATIATALTTSIVAVAQREAVQDIERIQDLVEHALWDAGYTRTARAYIVYREQHARLREDRRTLVDVATSIDEYLSRADWRVNANANQGYSLGGLILNSAGKMIANYWLSHVYPPEIGQAHREGDFHIHDLDFLSGYCAGWSLRMLLQEGLNGVPGKIEASPPLHMSSAVGQIVNFLGALQNEWAGAQALSSFDTYMAPYIRKDAMNYGQIKQNIQELVYNLNVPSRWGCVPPDTEILTTNGWKKYNAVNIGDEIYGFSNGSITLDNIIAINEYKYSGKMASLRSRGTDQLLTPNHRVLRYGDNQQKNNLVVETAETICNAETPTNIPVAGFIDNLEYPIEDGLLSLFAWILSKGTIPLPDKAENRIVINQSPINNAKYCTEIELLLNHYDPKYRVVFSRNGLGKGANRYRLSRPFSKLICTFIQKCRLPMQILRQCSVRQIRLFLDTYRKGDGEKGRFRITTKDIEIRDNLQELAVLAGYGTSIYESTSTLSGNKLFRISFLNKGDGSVTTSQKEWIDYSGTVWCPTTRSSFWVARRNNTVFITGNSQSPFTNLTFDWICPDDLKDREPIIGHREMPFKYGDLQAEMDLINRAYIEIMTEGDHKGRIFTFPIPTYNITPDFDWNSENANRLFAMTAKYGLPYFQNFIGSDLKPNMIRSMCCRLQLDLRELLKRGNGLFGSAEQTGSVGVVTINCARLGYIYKHNLPGLYARLDYLLEISKDSLEIKRKLIQRHMDAGLFPYTKRYLGTLRNHFSTIGVNGINEMIRNFTEDQHDITTDLGHEFALTFLDHIRARMVEFQETTGHMYNLEATPAEGTTYRFAKEDLKRCSGILQAGTKEAPYYTNSSQLPVNYTDDAFQALEMQEDLQRKYTGGTVVHLYMGERLSSTEGCKRLVKRALERFRIPYLTISPTFSICPVHGYLAGEHEYCPVCDEQLLQSKLPKKECCASETC